MFLDSSVPSPIANPSIFDNKSNDSKNLERLYTACNAGDLGTIRALLRDVTVKSLINTKNDDGLTPIMIAASKDHKVCVKFLMENGANLYLTDNDGQNILHIACKNGFYEILDLIGHNSDINAQTTNTGATPLMVALDNDKKNCAGLLIKINAELNIQDSEGFAALHKACGKGFDDITNLLISKGAKVNIQSNVDKYVPFQSALHSKKINCAEILLKHDTELNSIDGWTPLHYACKYGYCSIVKLLINKVDKNSQTPSANETALHIALNNNNLSCAELLINSSVDLNIKDSQGMTPLHIACKNGFDDIVNLLISKLKMAELDIQNNEGQTALHIALCNNKKLCSKFLIKNGADVDIPDNLGKTPLHIACEKEIYYEQSGINVENEFDSDNENNCEINFENSKKLKISYEDVIELLINKKASLDSEIAATKETPLLIALNNNRSYAKLLIKNGADVCKSDIDGRTALHIACEKGYADIVQMLIDKKVNLDKTIISSNRTALATAIFYGQKKCANLLIKNKANINILQNDGWSTLQLVCGLGYYDILQILLDYRKDDLNLNEKLLHNANTPLSTAVFNKSPKCVKLLIDSGVDLDESNSEDKTALHIACEKGYADIVQMLIDKKANLDKTITASEDKTALHIACENGRADIVQMLIDKKANLDKTITASQKTALAIALCCNQIECAKLLIVNNADINILADGMWNVLQTACAFGFDDIVQLLLNNRKDDLNLNEGILFNKQTPLITAVSHNKAKCVRLLIDNGANLDEANSEGKTALHMACEKGYADIVQMLIDKKVNLNKTIASSQETALVLALFFGQKECARLLIANGADVNIVDKNGCSPLHIACMGDYDDIVELIVAKVCSEDAQKGNSQQITKALFDIQDNNKKTALVHALSERKKQAAHLLIESGADINLADKNGKTPVHYACEMGWKDTLDLLISKKVNLEALTISNNTPLHIACKNGYVEIVQTLVDKVVDLDKADSKGRTALYLACEKGHNHIAKILIDKKVNLDHADLDSQETALHSSLRNNNFECAKLLIESGADLDLPDKDGWTALHQACDDKESADIAILLLNKNANPNSQLTMQGGEGWTPLHTAIEKGFYDVVKLLLEKDADIKIKVKSHMLTVLHLAAMNNRTECAKLLMEYDADINEVDTFGQTFLHIACEKGFYDLVKLIVDKVSNGAEESQQVNKTLLDIQDNNKNTALNLAFHSNREQIVNLLIESGVNVDLADEEGYSSIHYACRMGWKDTLDLLISKGANLELLTESKETALHISLKNCHEDIAQLLIDKVTKIIDLPNEYGIRPIHIACEKGYANIVRTLASRSDTNVFDYAKETPLHLSIKNKYEECTRILIENKAELNDNSDINGNSHFSLLLRSLNVPYHKELASKILPTSDLKRADSLRNTPLHYAVLHQDDEFINHIVGKLDPQDFIIKNIYFETPWYEKDASRWLSGLKKEEYALLEMDTNRMGLLSEADLKFLKDKYQSEADDFLGDIDLGYEINKEHLNNGVRKIPDDRAEVDLDGFLSMYDDLISKPYASIIDENDKDRSTLEGLISKVKNKTAYLGTPRANEKELLALFYKPIDSAFSHVLEKLQKLEGEEGEKIKIETLRTLLIEGNMCGGKISTMATNLYHKICLEKEIDASDMVKSKLAQYREYLIDASLPRHPQNIHDKTLIMHELGVKLGIPGGEEAKNFKDRIAGHGVDVNRIEIGFFRRYTTYTIADAIRKELKNDSEFKDKFVEYIEENLHPYEKWNLAFNEIVKSGGKLSDDADTKSIQEKIIKAINYLNPDESIEWDDLEGNATFYATQKLEVDLPVIMEVFCNFSIAGKKIP